MSTAEERLEEIKHYCGAWSGSTVEAFGLAREAIALLREYTHYPQPEQGNVPWGEYEAMWEKRVITFLDGEPLIDKHEKKRNVDVGAFNFCPTCARDAVTSDFEDDEPVCSCCMRVWPACPCSPRWEGDCDAIKDLNAEDE